MSERTFVYTAIGNGGRDGRIKTESGSFDLTTTLPGSRKPGATPEEFVAAAWAACFGTTLTFAAKEFDLDLSAAEVRASITYLVDHEAGRYELARADLEVTPPPGEHPGIEDALRLAHQRCPISTVFRDGIPELHVGVATADAAVTE